MDILERIAAEGRAAQADEAKYQAETFWLAHTEIERLRAALNDLLAWVDMTITEQPTVRTSRAIGRARIALTETV